MATGRGMQLTKQVGEFRVAAELARRGLFAAVLSGNTPDFDLVATDAGGRSVPVQVKASRSANWQFDAGKFVEISMDGDRQILGRLRPCSPNLVCVLVLVGEDGADRFFVLTMKGLQRLIVGNHRAWLERCGGVRPRNPKSPHTAVSLTNVESHEGKWDVINGAMV